MSRYETGPDGKRDPLEIKDALKGSVRLIRVLCDDYDNGNFYAAYSMAVEIDKLVDKILVIENLRKNRLFKCFTERESPTNLSKSFNFICYNCRFRSSESPKLTITFRPLFDDVVKAPKLLKFPNWYNRVIVRAGAGPGLMVPVNPTKQIPFEKRETIKASELIRYVRNQSGAHFDLKVNDKLEIAGYRDNMVLPIIINTPDGEIDTSKKSADVYYENTPVDATIRHLAYELLLSLDDLDLM